MPSNELTWALYGMAIVAAPIVAVWLWRRLGRRKRHKLGREVAPGWYMDFDDSTVGDMRIEPAPYTESAKALGSKPEAPWVTREEFEALANETMIALGVKPNGDWPINLWERETHAHNLAMLALDRLDALEANEPEAGRGGCRVWAVSGGWWLWDGSDVYYHEHGSGYWHTSPGWTVAKLPRDVFESFSNIRDLVVAEFLEWRGK